jgi:Right handed beta helix region
VGWLVASFLSTQGGCSSSSSGAQSAADSGVDGSAASADGSMRADAANGADAKAAGDSATSEDTGTIPPGEGGTTAPGDGAVAPPDLDASPITGLNGKTYYVATTGSDTNDGSMTAPWKTIQNAGPTVGPGDTVVVLAGAYDGAIFGWDGAAPCGDTDCTITGTAAHPILLEADPTASPGSVVVASKNKRSAIGLSLVGCDYVDVVGFTMTNAGTSTTAAGSITKAGISVAQSTGNVVEGNVVDGVTGIGGILVDFGTGVVVRGNTLVNTKGTGDTGHGMYLSGGSTGLQVLGNLIHDNAYVGIHINGDVASEGPPGVVTQVLIAGNVIYDNGQNGINADGLESSTIENNVIYGNARDGIELYQIDAAGGSTGNVIVNNTIDQSMIAKSYAIEIDACDYDGPSPSPAGCTPASEDSSTGNIAFNDILLGGSGGGASNVVTSADLALSTNLTTAASGLFVNAAGGNYQLSPGGPGVGAGIGSFGGAQAPAAPGGWDIGAFDFE